MAQKTKDLETWCQQNEKNNLLTEWEYEKNMSLRFPMSVSEVQYNSPLSVFWKCQNGHEWKSRIVARTLFDLQCPICNPEMRSLPVGTKYGCLTIIAGVDAYENEVAQREIAELKQKKQEFLDGKVIGNINSVNSVEDFEHRIQDYKSRKYYKCQCKCGEIQFIDDFHFLKNRHKYCDSIYDEGRHYANNGHGCGLRVKQEQKRLQSYERIYDDSYNIDFSKTIHESLEILECVDDNYEELYSQHDRRKKGSGKFKVYKMYRCRCYLCGKEQTIKSSAFSINPPTEYGVRAYGGYYSEAYCDCHKISSFQWIVTKILKENNVPYRVEVSFPELYGTERMNQLRYDFSVLNSDGSIKCLIECQGEQHFKPVDEFGGKYQFEVQKKNDNLKRIYASEHNIPLYEIPYTSKKFEKVESFLRLNKII